MFDLGCPLKEGITVEGELMSSLVVTILPLLILSLSLFQDFSMAPAMEFFDLLDMAFHEYILGSSSDADTRSTVCICYALQ